MPVLFYSVVQKCIFRPAAATCCPDKREIWHGGSGAPKTVKISNFGHKFAPQGSVVCPIFTKFSDFILIHRKLGLHRFPKGFRYSFSPKIAQQLEGYGICGDLLAWLTAFLSNRTQVVSINGYLILFPLLVVYLKVVCWDPLCFYCL